MSNYKGYKTKLKNIKAFAFDVDGVFTDGKVYLPAEGPLMRSMHVKDGFAVKYAVDKGYHIFIISGGKDGNVRQRFEYLGVQDIFLGVNEKLPVLKQLLEKYKLQPDEVAYMGDDIPDLEVLKFSGLSTCPSDAVPEVKSVVDYISPYPGGETCVRDLIRQVLLVRGDWPKV